MTTPETQYLERLIAGWKRILFFGLLTAFFGAALSFVFPLEYSASMRLLIIQRTLSEADPYTAIKSAERLSDNLAQIVYTTDFYDKVMASKFNIDQAYFKADERKRRDQWRDMISTSVTRGSGMLVVNVYHEDPDQAEQVASAIAFVLTTEGWQYVGGDLQVKLVDEPLQSRWPTRPNVPANSGTGLVLGVVLGAGLSMKEKKRHGLIG